jgi:hypothetical protein
MMMMMMMMMMIIQGLIRAVSPQLRRFKDLVSYEDSKRSEMSLLPNTETTHNSYAACGRKDNTNTAQKHKALTSHYFGQKRK